jgi:hypothetical protein
MHGYKDARIKTPEEKKKNYGVTKKCKIQYYDVINKMIDNPELGTLYDEMDTKVGGIGTN